MRKAPDLDHTNSLIVFRIHQVAGKKAAILATAAFDDHASIPIARRIAEMTSRWPWSASIKSRDTGVSPKFTRRST
jgi:hypothetical protein